MNFTLNTVTVLVGGAQYILSNLPAGTQEELQMLNELQELSDTHAFESSMYGERPKSEKQIELEQKVGALYGVWKSVQIGYSPFSEEMLDSLGANQPSYYKRVTEGQDNRNRLKKIFESIKEHQLHCDWDNQAIYVGREFGKNGNPARLEKYNLQKQADGSWDIGYSYVCASEQMWDTQTYRGLTEDYLAAGYWQKGFPVNSFNCHRKAKNALRLVPRQLRRYM